MDWRKQCNKDIRGDTRVKSDRSVEQGCSQVWAQESEMKDMGNRYIYMEIAQSSFTYSHLAIPMLKAPDLCLA